MTDISQARNVLVNSPQLVSGYVRALWVCFLGILAFEKYNTAIHNNNNNNNNNNSNNNNNN